MHSINNRLVVEQYVKEGLKSRVVSGIATPGQRDGLKGLKVLIDFQSKDVSIPKGSIVYVREEALHTHAWASKPLTCDRIGTPFMMMELSYVEIVDCPNIAEGYFP
jgi:hypothetical protein